MRQRRSLSALFLALFLVVVASGPVAAQTVSCSGVAAWSATTTYPVGARVAFKNGLYEAIASTTNVPPDYCPSCGWWKFLGNCGSADPTPPSVPTGLASPSKTTSTVALTWNASTDGTGGSGVAGYDVFRDNALVGSPTSTSFTDSGLAAGSTHSYAVRAR